MKHTSILLQTQLESLSWKSTASTKAYLDYAKAYRLACRHILDMLFVHSQFSTWI